MTARRSPALLCALLVALTGACRAGGTEEPAPTPGQSEEVSEPAGAEAAITIADFTFSVPETVEPGAEITVTNEDTALHTVTADDGAFDVAAPGGETVTFTAPTEPGEYAFHCGPHPDMVATLVVG